MHSTSARPEVEGLFTWPSDTPQLIAGRCTRCNCYFFPQRAEFHRPGCWGGEVEQTMLSRQGTVLSHTVQHYPPPQPFVAPEPFASFVLVTVGLPEGIQVAGQLVAPEGHEVAIGQQVEVTVDVLYTDDEGTARLTWKFQPVSEATA